MCTSTVAVAEALPAQPATVIGDSTVVRSGIGTSVPLVAVHPVGFGEGDGVGAGVPVLALRLTVHESMRPMSPAAASWTRSLHVPLAGLADRFTVYVWS